MSAIGVARIPRRAAPDIMMRDHDSGQVHLAAVTVFSFCCAGPVLAAASADAQFTALAARFIDEYGIYSPIGATRLGDHRRDAEVDDVSAVGRERGLVWTRGLQAELAKIPREGLSRENQIDAAMLDNQLRYSVWSVEKYRDWSWDPLIYTGVAGDALYTLLARDYARLAWVVPRGCPLPHQVLG